MHAVPDTQRAAVLVPYTGLTLQQRPVRRPRLGEVLVRTSRVGICGSDHAYYAGKAIFPVTAPLVLGHEASATVVELGPGVNGGLTPGDRVALVPGVSCGDCALCASGRDNLCDRGTYLGSAATTPHVDGALQQYLVMRADRLVRLPDTLSDGAAAMLEPFAVAHHALSGVDVEGRSVLVLGGGTIGQLAALVARGQGAATVVVDEVVPRRRKLALTHGADAALSPDELVAQVADGARFDVVVEATGRPDTVEVAIDAAEPGRGALVLVGNLPTWFSLAWSRLHRREIAVRSTFRFPGGLLPALDVVLSAGLDLESFVEEVYPLDEVCAAFERLDRADAPLKVHLDLGESEL